MNNQNSLMVMITSCYKNRHKIEIIRKYLCSLLGKFNISYKFIIGNSKLKKAYMYNDIIFLPCPDSYEYLPNKIFLGLNYLYHHYPNSFFLKIDDDTFINPYNLINLSLNSYYLGKVKKVDMTFNRQWHRGKCSNRLKNNLLYPQNRIIINSLYAKGECGYFIHRSIIPILNKHRKYIITDLYEDKAIGDVLFKNGIKPKDMGVKYSKLYQPRVNLSSYTIIVDTPISKYRELYKSLTNPVELNTSKKNIYTFNEY